MTLWGGVITFVEIGARMGGGCIGSDLVQLSTGNDYIKMVLDVACGREPEFTSDGNNHFASIRFLMKEEDMSLLETAEKGLHVVRVNHNNTDRTQAVTDDSNRHGYFIVTDSDYDIIRNRLFNDDTDVILGHSP